MSTVTLDLTGYSSYNVTVPEDYITVASSTYPDFIDNTQYEIDFGEEWRTHFPDFNTVEEMCKQYPALEKAVENFKTIYEMVKDDYASKIKGEDQ